MNILPIVERELRVASRRRETYWSRAAFGAAAVAFAAMSLATQSALSSLGVVRLGAGLGLFHSLAGVSFAACAIAAVLRSADCISVEKREGTIGFLFLTDLTGKDIVLGKLVAAALPGFCVLLAVLPVLTVALLLGGVGGDEIVRTALALLNLLFFCNAACLLASTVSRETRQAGLLAMLIVGTYLIGFVMLGALANVARWASMEKAFEALNILNPAYPFAQALQYPIASGRSPGLYWVSLAASDANAWLFLALASWLLPRVWREKAKKRIGWRERFRQWLYGSAERRAAFRRKMVAINPFYWLVSRNRFAPASIWTILAMLVGLWALFLVVEYQTEQPSERAQACVGFFVFAACLLHGTVKLLLAAEAGHHLEEQRQSGALEFILCSTPLSERDIIDGQWLALRRQFLRPVIAILAMDAGMMMVALWLGQRTSSAETREMAQHCFWGAIAAIIVLAADAVAIGWTAMWSGLAYRKRRHSGFSDAVVAVLVMPWVLFGAAMAAYQSPLFARYPALQSPHFPLMLIHWLVISIAWDAFLVVTSRKRLLKNFRRLAATAPEPVFGVFARIGRYLGSLRRKSAFCL